MIDVVLMKDLDVKTFNMQMAVGFPSEQRKKDILPFLRMVDDVGSTDAKDVNLNFFMEESPVHVYGKRWLKLMEANGLIQNLSDNKKSDYSRDTFELTEIGEEMLEMEQIMIMEYGTFKVSYTKDPLIPNMILDCERRKEKVQDKLKEHKEKFVHNDLSKGVETKTIAIENQIIDKWKGKILRLSARDNQPIYVVDINERIENIKSDLEAKLLIEYLGDESPIFKTLCGPSNEPLIEKPKGFIENGDEVLELIIESAGYIYEPEWERILLRKDQITGSIVKNNQLTIPDQHLHIQGFGKFVGTIKTALPCFPLDYEAAKKWIEMAISIELSGYVIKDDYIRVRNEKIRLFEPFIKATLMDSMVDDYDTTIISVMRNMDKRNRVYWNFMAPYDLSSPLSETEEGR